MLQGSHTSCFTLWQQDMESHQIGLGTAQGISCPCSIQDGKGALTKEGDGWGLALSKQVGPPVRMGHGQHCHIYPGPASDDHNVRCNQANLDGLSGRQMLERVNAAEVVVGATNLSGRNQSNWI